MLVNVVEAIVVLVVKSSLGKKFHLIGNSGLSMTVMMVCRKRLCIFDMQHIICFYRVAFTFIANLHGITRIVHFISI